MSELVLCSVCHRHVKRTDAACPFCHGAMRTAAGVAAAAAVGIGLTLAACNSTALYGAPYYGGAGGFAGGAGGTAGEDAGTGGTGGANTGGANTGGGAITAYGPPPPTDAGTD